ncbi:ABC-type multidrug transport system, ATPase and permease component [Aquiflexum balticum DSM 16537]|uniref:Multidrug resistance-like ATP-binding protein MdlB n=1 Tax=Aquiflexum balticum DSM 16537 TaxID=758820 RepID=A0A1W2HAY8_9BACT|nr:ABC transporter ATP-binding protein [Aquiflexum balticum]SMD46065.1 ABC-type multidrug transport system, ATPase and permease component [Aquiflexum balticum DSM 16537]
MKRIINHIKGYFTHFSFFYDHLRYRLFLTMGLNISVGLLDGFGLVMFLPLLQMVDGNETGSSEDLGGLGFIVDGIENLGFQINLKTVLIFILVFFSLKGVARFIESYYRIIVQNYFIKILRIKSINYLKNFRYKAFVESDSGRIQNTLSGEINRVSGAANSYFMALQGGVMVIVYSVLAFMANPQFALMVFIGGIISNSVFKFINRATIEGSRKVTQEGHDFQGLLMQKITFFKYLKATGLIEIYSKKLEEIVENINTSNIKMGYYGSIMVATREPLVMAIVVSVILIQTLVFGQNIALIILSLLFFYRALTFLMSLQSFYNSFLTNAGALENLQSFLNELLEQKELPQGLKEIVFQDTIHLENVSFSYKELPVLKNIDLSIHKNQTVAFVGESGSGKTTLVNLICGLIAPTEGELKIDGIPIPKINLSSYQYKIGYITQEPVIFSDTVYNNVTFWAVKTPENLEKFWSVLKNASISDFVKELPEGEDSQLGSNGILVSGGQKQRISIARELYKDIDILIMDEATSALDSDTEKIIQDNIEMLKGKLTILIVAHRLATIKNADKIVLISKGELKAIADFENLVKQSSLFKKMVELQEF